MPILKNSSNNLHLQKIIDNIRNNNIEAIKSWFEEPEMNINSILNGSNFVALHYASIFDHIEIVKLLLNHRKLDPNIQNKDGRTALHYATHSEIVKLLLNHPNINPNEQDKHGWTALHSATSNGYVEILQLLLQHQKTNLNVKNRDGQTALGLATYHIANFTKQYAKIKQENANKSDKASNEASNEAYQKKLQSEEIRYQAYIEIKKIIENHLNEQQDQSHIPNARNIINPMTIEAFTDNQDQEATKDKKGKSP